MELVILIGLPASGKSTFCRERLVTTHAWVSKDHFPNAKNRERRQQRLIVEALAAGRSVAVDNTNPRAEDRAPLIALGRTHGARVVGYFFASRVEESQARNALREGRARVPDIAIFSIAGRLTRPSPDEGFDALHFVRLVPEGFQVEPFRFEDLP